MLPSTKPGIAAMHAVPSDEQERLAALRGLGLLDTGHEERFDRITRLAAALLDVPIALVTLVDGERHWFKSAFGIDVVESPRDSLSFCGRAIQSDAQFVVPDTLADPHFCGNPLVTGNTGIRFYAGRPLKTTEGSRVGTLCVMARKPHTLTAAQSALLEDLAAIAEDELNHVRRDSTIRNQLAAIVENSHDAIYSRSLDGIIRTWNAGAERMLGYTAAEAIGKPGDFCIPPGRPSKLQQNFERLLRGERVDSISDRMTKDGRLIDVINTHSFVRDGAGNIVGVSVILRDITALKRAEAALKESEARFRATFEQAAVGIAHVDLQGSTFLVNRRYCEITGYSPEELVGKKPGSFTHPDDVGLGIQQRVRLLAGAIDQYANDVRYRHKNGKVVWVRRTQSLARDDARKPLYFIRVIEDITERRQAERMQAQLAAIVESSNDAIYSRSLDGTITSWNAGAERMFGYTAAEAIGKPGNFAVPSTLPHRIAQNNEQLLRGERFERERERVTRDGRLITVVSSFSPIKDSAGNTTGVSVIARDITALKQAQAAQMESEARFRATFDRAGVGISHVDLQGRIVMANRRYCEITGYTVTELQSLVPGSTAHPDDRGHLGNLRSQLLAGAIDEFINDVRYFHKNGHVIWVRRAQSLVRNAAHEPLYFIRVIEDITERKRIEDVLRLTQFSVDSSTDPVFWIKPDGEIAFVNNAACRMVGRARDALVGKKVPDVDPHMPAEKWPAHWEELKRKKSLTFESGDFIVDGKLVHTETTANHIQFEGQEYNCAIMRDITARKQAESVRASLAAIVDSSNDAIISRGPDLKVLSWNPAAERLFGYTAEEAIGRDVTFIIPPERMEESLHNRQRLEQGEPLIDRETERLCKDGRRIDVSMTQSLITDSSGNRFGVGLMFRDITERKRADATRALLATIVDNATDAIVSRTLDGIIMSWNAAAEKMFGYTADEAVGQPLTIIMPTGLEYMVEQHSRLIATGKPVPSADVTRRAKDGRALAVRRSISPIRNATQQVIGAAVIMHDISELKRAEETRTALEAQLRESHKMQAIGTLAGGIAHDFNNIIAIVLGNLDLARQDAARVPRVLESLERIQLASERARSLVQQILAFSRRQPTTRVPVNLATVVADTERLLFATMPARIHFSVDCDPTTPQVLADAMQIQQVLINLATNAMQALHDNTGHITLQLDSVVLDERMIKSHTVLREMRTRHPGAVVRLSVQDDGAGMDATTLERVFEPFFTTRPAGEGTGLGLSVVLGIVQAHDGAITVESRARQGTTFTLYFPPATSPAYASSTIARPAGAIATVDAPAAVSDAQRKAHVLYIDDDADLAYLMKRLLERRGYEISTYIDPRAALGALAANPAGFDLMLTDYNMPGMSGLEVARAARAICVNLQIAVTSGFIDETLQSQAASAGVAELIFKADSVETLCDAVQRLVDNGKAT